MRVTAVAIACHSWWGGVLCDRSSGELLHDGAAAQTVEGRCGKGLDCLTVRVPATGLFLSSQLSLELNDERAHDSVGLVRVCDISQGSESLTQRTNQMQGTHDAQSICWPFALAIRNLPDVTSGFPGR